MTPAQIFVILGLVQQYGPGILNSIKTILSKKDATIADVEAIFSDLKPYADFGIPEVVPVNQTQAGPV